MNFRRRHKEHNRYKRIAAIALVVVVGVSVLQYINVQPFESVVHATAEPVWTTENMLTASVGGAFSALFQGESEVRQENARLQQRIQMLEGSDASYAALKDENERLRELANSPAAQEGALLSSVLAQPDVSPYDTLIIDTGIIDGVEKRDLVAVAGDTIIGHIEDVYRSTAKVLLFSAPGVETRVKVGDQGIPATAVGIGGGNFAARIPRNRGIEEGDAVVVPGLNPNVFARVQARDASAADPFEIIQFASPVNIFEVSFVQVLTERPRVPLQALEAVSATSTVRLPDVIATTSATSTGE